MRLHATVQREAESSMEGARGTREPRAKPRSSRRRRVVTGFGVLAALFAAIVVTVQAYEGALNWRLKVYVRKLQGDLRELSWSELAAMTAGRDRFKLAVLVDDGRSLEAAIVNP